MLSQILAIFTTIKEVIELFKQAWSLYQQARVEGWIAEGKTIAEGIKNLQTDDERKELVKKLSDYLSNRP